MLHTLAIENYRSLRSIVVPLGRLNVIQGANGSGKSNLYKALRLLADTASGGIVSSLAREGGLKSTFWAGPAVRARTERGWQTLADGLGLFESIFVQITDPNNVPEVLLLRETIRSWRFYDQLRTDFDAPSRIPRLGTRTPVLGHDGGDLAASIQTILEVGDADAVNEAVDAAFPGASLNIAVEPDGRFAVEFQQPGLLRPLSGAELSDGTLRFLLWFAALLTPRPPSMMVLNEPETSLHPDLLPALSRLIIKAAETTQVWVVTHSPALMAALRESPEARIIELEKDLGQTQVKGQNLLERPQWKWVE